MDSKDKLISDAIVTKVKLVANKNEQAVKIEEEIQIMGEVIDQKISEFQQILKQKIRAHEEE